MWRSTTVSPGAPATVSSHHPDTVSGKVKRLVESFTTSNSVAISAEWWLKGTVCGMSLPAGIRAGMTLRQLLSLYPGEVQSPRSSRASYTSPVKMASWSNGPWEVFHVVSETTVVSVPSVNVMSSCAISLGMSYHMCPSTVRSRWLYHPLPSTAPMALEPCVSRSDTSKVL